MNPDTTTPDTPPAETIAYGLAGVVVDTTAVSKVVPETNSLTYRGYPVQQLATRPFEDVAYLLWNGELPTDDQRSAFAQEEKALRPLDDDLLATIATFSTSAHPMDTLRTAVSFMGQAAVNVDDAQAEQAELLQSAITLMAKIPTAIAADYRLRNNKDIIAADPSLGFVENFFHMCFGEVPDDTVVKCFDTSLTLYAEHSFNASTFAARVITSTQSDMYAAVTGAIGCLKGPLHGGANEQVMHMLQEVGSPENAAAWLQAKLASKEKIMGFGHRVYQGGDSRVPTMTDALSTMVDHDNSEKSKQIWDTSKALEKAMFEAKGIHPNLDYPAGPAYYLMGFDIPLFTPIFVMARIVGWTAHIMEQASNNKLIRPLSAYVGPSQRDLD